MSEQHTTSLADRYGSRTSLRGRLSSLTPGQRRWGLIGFLAVLTIIAIWFTFTGYLKPYNYKEVGHIIHSPSRVSVEFQVAKKPQDTVVCALEALNEVYAVVGYKTFTIYPVDEHGVQRVDGAQETHRANSTDRYYRADLRTDSQAVTVVVKGCRVAETR